MLRLMAAFVSAISLASCVTTSDVVSASQEMYMISAANNGCSDCEPPKSRATRRANAYCAKLNKTMMPEDAEVSEIDFGLGERYALTFSCFNAAAAH